VKTLSQSLSRAKIERDWIFIEGTNAKGRVLTSKTPLPLPKLDAALAADISAVSQIDAVASILEVICRTTGMGFAAVARVTQDRWIAYAVRDEIAFGLLPGGELDVTTTICDEIRDSGRAVVIDHVAESELFHGHHMPRIYCLQSYISMPIVLPNGAFFGALCAIDPRG
jgi:GAF domain-containing protein